MVDEKFPYDPTNKQSIIVYAQQIVGKTLRQVTGLESIQQPCRRRGSLGNAVEEYYFKYAPSSSSAPDFDKVGLELKTTPLKMGPKGELVAKERLVLSMIDYDEVVTEDFEHSHMLNKASDILLMSYLWEPDKDPLDYVFKLVEEIRIPREDLPQIKSDWETVVGKVRLGHAEDISGSDTMYLEACTKAADSSKRRSQPFSDVPAKPRAWAFKASYMTVLENGILENAQAIARGINEEGLSLLDLVRNRFSPFFGLSEEELADRFSLTKSKNLCARITRCILGVDVEARIEEFEKAGICPKTIRMKRNGSPKEVLSFSAFKYAELEQHDFEESAFYEYLQQKYLFVLFQEECDGKYYLHDICFWQMPEKDYPEAKRCYDQMRENVREGHAERSVGTKENRCCHVRPHARDGKDVIPQPHGLPVVKKCFWLNQAYLAAEIHRVLDLHSGKEGD